MVFAIKGIGEVTLMNRDGTPKSALGFIRRRRGGVFGLTRIDEKLMGVSNPEAQTISIINVDSVKVIKTIQIKSGISGITYSDGNIYFCVPANRIMKVNMETEMINKIHHDPTIDNRSVIDTDGNRICYTCYNQSTVTVLDSQGQVLFTFKDNDTMSGPYGISMDEHQNMFVSSYNNHNLLLISKDGTSCDVLLSKNTESPSAVHYNKNNKELLLVDANSSARVYSVT